MFTFSRPTRTLAPAPQKSDGPAMPMTHNSLVICRWVGVFRGDGGLLGGVGPHILDR